MTDASDYLRNLFNTWVGTGGVALPDDPSRQPDPYPLRWLCRQLIDCTDPLPADIAGAFVDDAGKHLYQTYGDVAKCLIPEIDYQEEHAALSAAFPGGPQADAIKKNFVVVGAGPWGVSLREKVTT